MLSGSKTLATPTKNSSNPLRTIVSEYPHSALHTGHFFVRASSPVYQLLTHVSQPSNVLQHLLKIGGAAIGAWRQILHLNASIINCFKARGTELVLSSSFISRTTDAISAMSSLISSKVSLWILDLFLVLPLHLHLNCLG